MMKAVISYVNLKAFYGSIDKAKSCNDYITSFCDMFICPIRSPFNIKKNVFINPTICTWIIKLIYVHPWKLEVRNWN